MGGWSEKRQLDKCVSWWLEGALKNLEVTSWVEFDSVMARGERVCGMWWFEGIICWPCEAFTTARTKRARFA